LSDIDTGATWAALEVMLVVDDKLFEISIHLIHPGQPGQIMFQRSEQLSKSSTSGESDNLTPSITQFLF
jgi:hypothetical protein